jgi:hypothetical protein
LNDPGKSALLGSQKSARKRSIPVLIEVPKPFASFRSIRSSESPFEALRKFLAHEVEVGGLAFSEITLKRCDWSEFRFQTSRWLFLRNGNDDGVEGFSIPGETAPLITARVRPGFALVSLSATASVSEVA